MQILRVWNLQGPNLTLSSLMLAVGKGTAHGLADCRLRTHVQPSLGGDVQRAPAPLLETSLSAPDFIFLEASNA